MSKERRLSRIFAKDGKSVTLALDGYYFSTKTNGIDNTINQLPALVEHGLDCALVTYGMLKNYREALNSVLLCYASTARSVSLTIPFPILPPFFPSKMRLKSLPRAWSA